MHLTLQQFVGLKEPEYLKCTDIVYQRCKSPWWDRAVGKKLSKKSP